MRYSILTILCASTLYHAHSSAYWYYGRCYHCTDDSTYIAGDLFAGASALIGTGIMLSEGHRAHKTATAKTVELRELRRELHQPHQGHTLEEIEETTD